MVFYDTRDAARKAGFRPCKRCRPDDEHRDTRHRNLVEIACRRIDEAGQTPKLADLALDAGFGANGRFYETAPSRIGMTASALKRGGQNVRIRFEVADSWLGAVLIAATDQGVCAILFGDGQNHLTADLQTRFPNARIEPAEPGSDFTRWVTAALSYIEAPAGFSDLPLDVCGTAFQERVWRALRVIPAGTTSSYSAVASQIGKPKATRAVAQACAANPAAVVIPCHRVVRADGGLSGYRWGEARKRKLLEAEGAI